MDKGKRPIVEEEEDFLSLYEDDNYDPNVILSPTRLAPPEFSIIPSGGLGSARETSMVDEMEATQEDFFRKFLNMNFVDESLPNMNEQYSILPTSKAADFPVAEAHNQPPEIYPIPALPPLPTLPPLALDSNAGSQPFIFRKIMPPGELAEVAICDPKRARRIMTNRLSAIKAKEKKKLYMYMLEQKLQYLQAKSTKFSVRLTLLQTESNSLNSEHNLLKEQMDIMTQQLHLQDLLNDQIRSEIQHMRNVLAQIKNSGSFNGFPRSNNNASLVTAVQQLEQLQLRNPHQQGNFLQQQVHAGHFQQHTYLGLCNFGGEYERGECSQHHHHQQQQQNPQPFYQYQVQNNEEEQPSKFVHMRAEDYSEDSQPSPNEEQK